MGRSFNNGGSIQPFDGQEILSAFICPALPANTNDYFINNRGFVNASVLYVSATGAINLTGLVGATANRELLLFNTSANIITLKNASGLSALANRFNFGADVALNQFESVKLLGLPSGGWGTQGGAAGGASSGGVGALVTQAIVQSLPGSANTAITWDTKVFDTGGFWNAGSDTKFTITKTGLYLLSCNVFGETAGGPSIDVFGGIRINGATVYGTAYAAFAGGSGGNAESTNQSLILNLNATNFVEATIFAQTGNAVTIVAATSVGINVASTFSIVSL